MKRGKKLTLGSLGHVEDKRFRLSPTYSHTRGDYKVVDDEFIVGYRVVGDGYRSPVRIAPIFDASIWIKIGRVQHIINSHEIGAYYELPIDGISDHVAHQIAASARNAIIALVERQAEYKRVSDTYRRANGRLSSHDAKKKAFKRKKTK